MKSNVLLPHEKGAIVEWLKTLGCGAESRRKVVTTRLGFAIRQLENCQPSRKWISFSNQRMMQRQERHGLRLLSAVPRIKWASNPYCPKRLLDYALPLETVSATPVSFSSNVACTQILGMIRLEILMPNCDIIWQLLHSSKSKIRYLAFSSRLEECHNLIFTKRSK